jgi:hypothetical protein
LCCCLLYKCNTDGKIYNKKSFIVMFVMPSEQMFR